MIKKIVKGYNKYNLLLNNLDKFVNKKDIYLNNILSSLLINEKLRKNFQNLDIIKKNFQIFKKINKNNFKKIFKISNVDILENSLKESINKNNKIKIYNFFLKNLYKQNLAR